MRGQWEPWEVGSRSMAKSEFILESFLAVVIAQVVGNGKDLASIWVRPGERRVRAMARGPGREGQTAGR